MPTDRRPALRGRARQPGHDRQFETAEQAFLTMARSVLPDDEFVVQGQPADLRSFYGQLGLRPDAKVTHLGTGRYVFVEVKRQGDKGNAEERAYKHHTMRFARELAAHTGFDYHAYVTVFCGSLAQLPRYTTKIPLHIEDGHFLLWRDYRRDLLEGFLTQVTGRLLDPSGP